MIFHKFKLRLKGITFANIKILVICIEAIIIHIVKDIYDFQEDPQREFQYAKRLGNVSFYDFST